MKRRSSAGTTSGRSPPLKKKTGRNGKQGPMLVIGNVSTGFFALAETRVSKSFEQSTCEGWFVIRKRESKTWAEKKKQRGERKGIEAERTIEKGRRAYMERERTMKSEDGPGRTKADRERGRERERETKERRKMERDKSEREGAERARDGKKQD